MWIREWVGGWGQDGERPSVHFTPKHPTTPTLLCDPPVCRYLGIYSKNEWGLKPSIFEARLA